LRCYIGAVHATHFAEAWGIDQCEGAKRLLLGVLGGAGERADLCSILAFQGVE
jgi:hypothetical protein